MTYGLAEQAVFATLNGEGYFSGVPMVFIRLAGCPVNCANCDTNYELRTRATAADIARRCVEVADPATEWCWLTGGEPTDHDLAPLFAELKRAGFKIAVATAGVRELPPGADFVSVSPHFLDARWVVRKAEQVNLVPGLNGLKLADVDPGEFVGFAHRWVSVNGCGKRVTPHPLRSRRLVLDSGSPLRVPGGEIPRRPQVSRR